MTAALGPKWAPPFRSPGAGFLVLGLDPGTSNPALATLNRNSNGWHILRLPVLKSLDGLLSELAAIHHSGLQVGVCCVEKVAWALHSKTQGHGSGRILESVGALRAFAAIHRIPLVEVAPSQWRKAIAGSAKATKEQVRTLLSKRVQGWPQRQPSLNRSDAVAVAISGAGLSGSHNLIIPPVSRLEAGASKGKRR